MPDGVFHGHDRERRGDHQNHAGVRPDPAAQPVDERHAEQQERDDDPDAQQRE